MSKGGAMAKSQNNRMSKPSRTQNSPGPQSNPVAVSSERFRQVKAGAESSIASVCNRLADEGYDAFSVNPTGCGEFVVVGKRIEK